MRHRSSIPKDSDTDPNVLAHSIVSQVAEESGEPAKNAAAVMLGRLGGLKGGKARAKSLSKAERKAIAKKAAKARWKKS